jgi:transcriptional regulator with XRE-family HTH domain
MSTTLQVGITYPVVIGAMLAKLRKEKGLTQEELATAVDVTQATWSRIEKGAAAATIEQLALASDRLKIPVHQVLKLADDAVEVLQQQGIQVKRTRVDEGQNTGLLMVGAAAVGALLTAVFLDSKGDSKAAQKKSNSQAKS